MIDYKELYFSLFRATEHAIDQLIAAQQACEEHYLTQTEEPGEGEEGCPTDGTGEIPLTSGLLSPPGGCRGDPMWSPE